MIPVSYQQCGRCHASFEPKVHTLVCCSNCATVQPLQWQYPVSSDAESEYARQTLLQALDDEFPWLEAQRVLDFFEKYWRWSTPSAFSLRLAVWLAARITEHGGALEAEVVKALKADGG